MEVVAGTENALGGHTATVLLEGGAPHGPYGVKSIGEPAIIPTAAAIANALYNATGRRIDVLPMTPQRLIERLEQPR